MAAIAHTFEGKKPSKAQIITKCKDFIKAGFSSFDIYWGENWLEFQLANNRLHGHGWIKNISASDIADTLNTK